MDLSGKITLITGGSKGMGLGIAARFAADGGLLTKIGLVLPE